MEGFALARYSSRVPACVGGGPLPVRLLPRSGVTALRCEPTPKVVGVLRKARQLPRAASRRLVEAWPCLTALAFSWSVWKARLLRGCSQRLDPKDNLDLDLNVLPAVLPQLPPNGQASYSVTLKVWRKIVYWARVHERATYGRLNRLSAAAVSTVPEKVVVIGGGAFGTAMAVHVARRGYNVQVLMRDRQVCDFINKRHINPKNFPEFDLPLTLSATTNSEAALADCRAIILALPVQSCREALGRLRHLVPLNVPIVAVSKGLELGTNSIMSHLIPEALGRAPEQNPVVVVSGPSFAKEIMDRRPTSVVAASTDAAAAAGVQRLLTSRYFRVSITDDVVGVEVAGALKNVLAIAAGICEGLDLGLNAMSALVTQGNAEIRWLATAMGAKPQTLAGLSGMGDILLTCFGSLSRNRSVGVRLGKGEPLEDVLRSGKGVAEGVFTSRLVVELSDKHRVLMPVLTSVARILNREVSPRQAVFEVLSLPPLAESA